jgi:hypothetical protein
MVLLFSFKFSSGFFVETKLSYHEQAEKDTGLFTADCKYCRGGFIIEQTVRKEVRRRREIG